MSASCGGSEQLYDKMKRLIKIIRFPVICSAYPPIRHRVFKNYLAAWVHITTAYTAPAPFQPPCHEASPSVDKSKACRLNPDLDSFVLQSHLNSYSKFIMFVLE
ncbi:hypothetical protein EAI89_22060 [Eubacterium sp. am_0171]|nr:hypothetical protein EAI89_22060 [Eubacterium sp. am_0171]